MKSAPTCPRCRGPLHAPSIWSSAWECPVHGEVSPLQPIRRPCGESLDIVRSVAEVPVWVLWPLPDGWLVTGFADAGDDRTGARAVAVALSGPAPLGGPADLVLVAEEPGVGLGAAFAGLAGPDPGEGFGSCSPQARAEIAAHPVPLWAIDGEDDRAAYAGEAMGQWLWAVLWPAAAGVLLLEEPTLLDLREADLDLPYGAACPRLAG